MIEKRRDYHQSIFRECCSTISDFQLIFSASHSWYDPYLYPFSNHVADKKGAKGIYLTWIKYENPNEPDLIVWYHWFQSNYNSWSSFRYFSFFLYVHQKKPLSTKMTTWPYIQEIRLVKVVLFFFKNYLRMWATIIEISQKTFLIAPFCREFSTEFFKA